MPSSSTFGYVGQRHLYRFERHQHIVTGLSFGAWSLPGDVVQTVEVSMTSEPDGGSSYFDPSWTLDPKVVPKPEPTTRIEASSPPFPLVVVKCALSTSKGFDWRESFLLAYLLCNHFTATFVHLVSP